MDYQILTLLQLAAQVYGIDADALHPLEGGHFASVYGFNQQGKDYVLRMLPPQENFNAAELGSTLNWMHYLAEHGCPVVKPINSQRGNLVTEIPAQSGSFLVSAVTRAAGELAERLPFEAWTAGIFHALGAATGFMHRLSEPYLSDFMESPRPAWNQADNLFQFDPPSSAHPEIAERQRYVMSHIQHLPRSRESWGLVHLDLHFANFFVDLPSEQITLFDFDDCACGWFVMDLAMLLFDWSVLSPPDRREYEIQRLVKPLLAGYCSQKHLDSFWLEQIPLFSKLLELNLYLMLAPGFDPAQPDPWVEKFLHQRKEKILQDLPITPHLSFFLNDTQIQ